MVDSGQWIVQKRQLPQLTHWSRLVLKDKPKDFISLCVFLYILFSFYRFKSFVITFKSFYSVVSFRYCQSIVLIDIFCTFIQIRSNSKTFDLLERVYPKIKVFFGYFMTLSLSLKTFNS